MADVEAMADMVILAIKSALVPVQARQAALQEQIAGFEARWADLGALRERVAVVEAQAIPVAPETRLAAPDEALVDLRARLGMLETKAHAETVTSELAGVRERLAVLETRPQLEGQPGKDGERGEPGQDGKAGLTYQGVYQDGKSYDLGDVVTWAGSTWHCNEATVTKPGESAQAWTLMVKRGRDGKDGERGGDGKSVTTDDLIKQLKLAGAFSWRL